MKKDKISNAAVMMGKSRRMIDDGRKEGRDRGWSDDRKMKDGRSRKQVDKR